MMPMLRTLVRSVVMSTATVGVLLSLLLECGLGELGEQIRRQVRLR
jgi:hypothetical protein